MKKDMRLEREKEHFKDHVAKFTDYGNIKIVDFKNPNSSTYRIRFLFEEDYYRLHISGDLGELIATNYYNMSFEGFKDFVNNTGYFEEKINCHNRSIYVYDEVRAKEELIERIREYRLLDDCDLYEWEHDEDERIEFVLDDVFSDFSNQNGIGSKGYDVLHELDQDAWEWVSEIGKKETGILDLYMLAFRLAMEQLSDQNKTGGNENEN